MIESYDFGRIIIDGKEYLNDVIIFPDHVQAKWFRQEGHLLQMQDLDEVFAAKPKILIVGTGHSGVMKVDSEVREYCRMNEIKLIELPSARAVQEYNSKAGEGVIGAFHLTC